MHPGILRAEEDPEIKNNPDLAKKIRTEEEVQGGYSTHSVSLSFADDEMIGIVMRYLSKGNNVKIGDSERWRWTGLDEVIP